MSLLRMVLEEYHAKVSLEELAEVHEGGCVAFDFDGTLVVNDGWKGVTHVGEPIPTMIERLKQYRSKDIDVVIFTARVADPETKAEAIKVLENWCQEIIGEVLPITNEKTPDIVRIYDDRARQVLENTGEVVGE